MFLLSWYKAILTSWPFGRGIVEKTVLAFLPVAAFLVIVATLLSVASFDVVNEPFWVFFYIVLGFAWLWIGTLMMSACLDLSWKDDILNMNNRAALFAFVGGFLGLTIIYAGANVGDGPGWWCVVFAGGLGVVAWVVLAWILNLGTHALERITVERDVACGIRFGCYLLASGIILGRASAGDWTSAAMTVIEFGSGWPALPLVVFAGIGERMLAGLGKEQDAVGGNVLGSVILGGLLIVFAVASIIITPLIQGGVSLWTGK